MLYFAVLEDKMKSCIKVSFNADKILLSPHEKSDDEHLPSVSNWENTANGH